MLARIEQQVAATLGEKLAGRPHVAVVAAPGPPQELDPGKGRLVVALQEVLPVAGFREDEFALAGGAPPSSRRVLAVQFLVLVSARVRPAQNEPAEIAQAHTLLLDDLAHAAHALADESVRNGKALRAADADPGYDVVAFALEGATVARDLAGGVAGGELRYRGSARIWPPGVTLPEGRIETVAVQPRSFEVQPPTVAAGGTARIVIRGLAAPARLAARVMSDLDPAKRGTIANGVDGAEAGVRIIDVPAGAEEAAVDYAAPAAPLGDTRMELVAIHFATRQNTRGLLLGSIAMPLTEAPQ